MKIVDFSNKQKSGLLKVSDHLNLSVTRNTSRHKLNF